MTVVLGIVPTFAWRASVEERLLDRAFGERYAAYRERTKIDHPAPSLNPAHADQLSVT
jgi:protein-S-isoprenylcysteine O-methyltransferase Ste14